MAPSLMGFSQLDSMTARTMLSNRNVSRSVINPSREWWLQTFNKESNSMTVHIIRQSLNAPFIVRSITYSSANQHMLYTHSIVYVWSFRLQNVWKYKICKIGYSCIFFHPVYFFLIIILLCCVCVCVWKKGGN